MTLQKKEKQEEEAPSIGRVYVSFVVGGFKKVGYFILLIAVFVALFSKLFFGLVIATPGAALIIYCTLIERLIAKRIAEKDAREHKDSTSD